MVLTLTHLLLLLIGLMVLPSSIAATRKQPIRSCQPHQESKPQNYNDKNPSIYLKPAIGSIFPDSGNPRKTSRVGKPLPEHKTPIYKPPLFCIWIATCILFWVCQLSGCIYTFHGEY